MVGVVAKNLGGMAVIGGVPEAGLAQAISQQLDWVAAYSFMLFTLIYTPCLSTIAAIQRVAQQWLCRAVGGAIHYAGLVCGGVVSPGARLLHL